MSQAAELRFHGNLVTSHVTAMCAKDTALLAKMATLREALGSVSEVMSVVDSKSGKMDGLRDILMELGNLEAEVKAHKSALEDMGYVGAYEPSLELTSFKEVVEAKKLEKLQGPFKYNLARDEHMLKFMKHAGVDAVELGEDEELMMDGGDDTNAKCPISGKDVMDLADPVRDQMGYIYEKADMLAYIAQNRGRVGCPVQGTTHSVTANDLKPAEELKRKKKLIRLRQNMAQNTGTQAATQAGQDEDVIDVESDDE